MIALDTNVLVRFLAQDDDAQFEVAAGLIAVTILSSASAISSREYL